MENRQILQIIAASDPDFADYRNKYAVVTDKQSSLSSELIDTILALLVQEPQRAAAIDALRKNPDTARSFSTGGEVGLLIAVAFLLRTHVKLERSATGKWKFLVEHKPGDSKFLTGLLNKLEKIWELT